ncbi:MAG: CopD family protein, partial [Actinomycetota bacterium]
VGPDGTITTLAPPLHGASTSVISFTLPPGLTGAYTARWRLVSVDGHVISGRVTFAVGTGVDLSGVLADGAATEPDPGDPAPEPVRWALRLFGFVALMALGGLLVSDLYIVEGVFAALRDRAVLKVIAGALVVVPLLQMLIFLGDVFGTSIIGALSHLADVFDTTPGSMMFVRTVLGGVLCYQLMTVMRGRPTVSEQRLVLAAAGLYAFAQAYTGHSRSRAWPILGIPADTAHLAAAAVWLGGLAVLVLLVAPLLDPKDLWRSFERYGRVARLAVIALIVTGVIQTLRLHGGITTLFSQSHGRLLLLKLIVVAIMLRLGDMNRRRIAARTKDNPNLMEKKLREVTKAATIEVATGGVVLAVTAALVTASFS